jgi:hypothetical protein
MITPLVRIPLDTSGPHLSISHLFLFFNFFSTLSSSTHHLLLLQPSPGAREDPPPSAPVRRAVVVLVRAEAASPPSRAAWRRLVRVALPPSRRLVGGSCAEAGRRLVRGGRAEARERGLASLARGQAEAAAALSRSRRPERGVAAETAAGHSRAAGRRQAGSAPVRGGGTSGASATAERTSFVVPARVPLNPAGAAPSVEIWRTSPTRIISEYSFGVQPIPFPTPVQTPQKWIEPIRVGLNLATKHTVREVASRVA